MRHIIITLSLISSPARLSSPQQQQDQSDFNPLRPIFPLRIVPAFIA